jgi:hypothetical protein
MFGMSAHRLTPSGPWQTSHWAVKAASEVSSPTTADAGNNTSSADPKTDIPVRAMPSPSSVVLLVPALDPC